MLRKINYLWRLFGTGLAFASFSLGGLLLRLSAFPLIALLSASEQVRISRACSLINKTFRLLVFVLRKMGIIDVKLHDIERLRYDKGRLVVANHPTLFDVVLLVSLLPRARCLVKHSLLENKYFGGVLRAAGYIRNDEDPKLLLEQCQKAVQSGHDIVVFPEGTRSIPGNALKFKRGFANIAILAPCDIQPIIITCKPSTLTKGNKWYEIPASTAEFRISVEEELGIVSVLYHEPRSKVVRKITRDLEKFYNERLGHE